MTSYKKNQTTIAKCEEILKHMEEFDVSIEDLKKVQAFMFRLNELHLSINDIENHLNETNNDSQEQKNWGDYDSDEEKVNSHSDDDKFINKTILPLDSTKSWADYDSDDDNLEYKFSEKKSLLPKTAKWGEQVNTATNTSPITSPSNSPSIKNIPYQQKKNSYKQVTYKNKTKYNNYNNKKQYQKPSMEEIIKNRINVYSLDDFRECINSENKMKGCVKGWDCHLKYCKFYHILPDIHCEHTYNGTLCENVMDCDKIHIQRCKIEIFDNKECEKKGKSCSFIHQSDLSTDEAKQNFKDTMEEYKKKKYKHFRNVSMHNKEQ